MADYEPLHPSRHNATRHIYPVGISDQVEKFLHYHNQYASPVIAPDLMWEYIVSVIENMINHFDQEATAVQCFVGHYAELITQAVSPNYKYHPIKFLKLMEADGYQNYVMCLYGFAEDMFRHFKALGLYSPKGALLGSFEKYELGTLYLIVRPEVPNVFTRFDPRTH